MEASIETRRFDWEGNFDRELESWLESFLGRAMSNAMVTKDPSFFHEEAVGLRWFIEELYEERP